MKTFSTVFPDTYVWRSSTFEFPGFYLVGLKEHRQLDPSRLRTAGENKAIVADLNEWGEQTFKPEDMLKLFTLDPEQLSECVRDDRIISDDHPYTEFPLWRSLFDKNYDTRLQVASRLAQNR